MGFLKNTIHRADDLGDALRETVPSMSVTVADSGNLAGTAEIEMRGTKSASGASGPIFAERFLIRTWIADANMSEPDAQANFFVNLGTGEEMYEHEEDADYTVISTADGRVTMNIQVDQAKTVYVMAEIDGRVYSGSAAITS